MARGQAGPDSDVDLLVDIEPGYTLLDMGGLLMDLQDLLKCRVDITTEDSLHWYIKAQILKDSVPL